MKADTGIVFGSTAVVVARGGTVVVTAEDTLLEGRVSAIGGGVILDLAIKGLAAVAGVIVGVAEGRRGVVEVMSIRSLSSSTSDIKEGPLLSEGGLWWWLLFHT